MHDVGGLRLAEALDLHVVLVTPEVGHDDTRRQICAEHRGHDHTRLLSDIAPVFDARLVPPGVAPGSDVTDRPHMRCAGASGGVTHHAVVHPDVTALEPLGRRP